MLTFVCLFQGSGPQEPSKRETIILDENQNNEARTNLQASGTTTSSCQTHRRAFRNVAQEKGTRTGERRRIRRYATSLIPGALGIKTERNIESGESDGSVEVAKAPVLRETFRNISRSDFKKWSHPSERVQEDIQGILKAAERPVLMTFRKEGARTEAQRAVQKLIVK
jgi:hypothetical protein